MLNRVITEPSFSRLGIYPEIKYMSTHTKNLHINVQGSVIQNSQKLLHFLATYKQLMNEQSKHGEVTYQNYYVAMRKNAVHAIIWVRLEK